MNEQKCYTVYKHTSPDNKSYVGITSIKPQDRWGNNGNHYEGSPRFYKAIQEYGWDNFSHEILASNLTKSEAEEMEKQLIFKLNLQNPNYGFNKASGGYGGFNKSFNSQLCLDLWKQGYSLTELSREFSFSRKAIRNFLFKNGITQYDILNRYNNTRSKICGKIVLQIDKETDEIIAEYTSASQAAIALGKSSMCSGNITKICRTLKGTAYGYKWAYKNTNASISQGINILKLSKELNIVNKYNSIMEAAKDNYPNDYELARRRISYALEHHNLLDNYYWIKTDSFDEIIPILKEKYGKEKEKESQISDFY